MDMETPNDAGGDASSEQAFWIVPWEFAVHATVGAAIFATIAIPAVLLDFLLHYLESAGTSTAIRYGLTFGEFALLGTDLWLFLVFLWRTAKRTAGKL